MKIAFVRGPFLNPQEFQTYAPLTHRHAFNVIGGDCHLYTFPEKLIDFPLHEAPLWGGGLARIHPRLFTIYNRARSWTLGESFGFCNLESAVADSELLHSAETYSTMTYQCLQIRRRRGCKVVVTVWENLPQMGERHPRRKARKRQALSELDGFLAMTETARRVLLSEGAASDRIEVIPTAVNLKRFSPQPRSAEWIKRWDLHPDEKVVLFIGRWVEEKGVRDIVTVIPEVLDKFKHSVRFCFIGAGPLEPILKSAATRFAGRIIVEPFASYDHIPDLHRMADVFVAPSKPAFQWEEQFGHVLAESMACGKAIVTTRTGSIPDVVGEAAELVAPGDSAALTASLIRLLSSDVERQRLGAKALERAREHFDAEHNALQIERFYERILRRR